MLFQSMHTLIRMILCETNVVPAFLPLRAFGQRWVEMVSNSTSGH